MCIFTTGVHIVNTIVTDDVCHILWSSYLQLRTEVMIVLIIHKFTSVLNNNDFLNPHIVKMTWENELFTLRVHDNNNSGMREEMLS